MERERVRMERGRGPNLLGLAVMVGLWRVYDRRKRERVPSVEGLEDPAVSAAYAWVSNLPQMRWMRKAVSERAVRLQDHGEAVDLGCGTGQLVVALADRSAGLRVTGIDLSEDLLGYARQYARQAGLGERVDFRVGNAEAIPFPDESLDLVVSTGSLHHWANPVKVLDEIYRVLKPGGAYGVYDLRRDMPLPAYLMVWLGTQFVVPAALHQANEPMGSRNASYTPQELAELAKQTRLGGGKVTTGPMWVILEGTRPAL